MTVTHVDVYYQSDKPDGFSFNIAADDDMLARTCDAVDALKVTGMTPAVARKMVTAIAKSARPLDPALALTSIAVISWMQDNGAIVVDDHNGVVWRNTLPPELDVRVELLTQGALDFVNAPPGFNVGVRCWQAGGYFLAEVVVTPPADASEEQTAKVYETALAAYVQRAEGKGAVVGGRRDPEKWATTLAGGVLLGMRPNTQAPGVA